MSAPAASIGDDDAATSDAAACRPRINITSAISWSQTSPAPAAAQLLRAGRRSVVGPPSHMGMSWRPRVAWCFGGNRAHRVPPQAPHNSSSASRVSSILASAGPDQSLRVPLLQQVIASCGPEGAALRPRCCHSPQKISACQSQPPPAYTRPTLPGPVSPARSSPDRSSSQGQ